LSRSLTLLDSHLAIMGIVELCEPVIYGYSIMNKDNSATSAIFKTVTDILTKGLEDYIND